MKIFLVIAFALAVSFGLFAATASAAFPSLNFNVWQGTGQGDTTCNNTSGTGTPVGCSICDAVIVASNVVNNIVIPLGTILAVVFIVYGALRMMVSFGSESNFSSARSIITSAVIGLVIILCGWLIVNTLFTVLMGQPNFPWAQIKC